MRRALTSPSPEPSLDESIDATFEKEAEEADDEYDEGMHADESTLETVIRKLGVLRRRIQQRQVLLFLSLS